MQRKDFDLIWKKQLTLLLLLSTTYSNTGKYKMAMHCIYAAQKITCELDKDQPRNLDYMLAVNILTAFILIKINKLQEAVQFLEISDKILKQLVDYNIDGALPKHIQEYYDKLTEINNKIVKEKSPY